MLQVVLVRATLHEDRNWLNTQFNLRCPIVNEANLDLAN